MMDFKKGDNDGILFTCQIPYNECNLLGITPQTINDNAIRNGIINSIVTLAIERHVIDREDMKQPLQVEIKPNEEGCTFTFKTSGINPELQKAIENIIDHIMENTEDISGIPQNDNTKRPEGKTQFLCMKTTSLDEAMDICSGLKGYSLRWNEGTLYKMDGDYYICMIVLTGGSLIAQGMLSEFSTLHTCEIQDGMDNFPKYEYIKEHGEKLCDIEKLMEI